MPSVPHERIRSYVISRFSCHHNHILLLLLQTRYLHFFSTPDAGLTFTQQDFVVNEGDGTVDVCMELTPPTGGMECEVIVTLSAAGDKAGN